MTLYLDSSVLVGLYLREPAALRLQATLQDDPTWTSAWHGYVEVRRNLARALTGARLAAVLNDFEQDWDRAAKVELDPALCRAAASLAARTGVRTLDALHLAAAERAGGSGLTFLTRDVRLANAARSLGWPVLGA